MATTFANTMSMTGTQDLFDVDAGDTLKKRIAVEQAESGGDTKKEAACLPSRASKRPLC